MARGTSSTDLLRFALLVCLSVALMIVDFRSQYAHYIRSTLAVFVTPLQVVATVPQEVAERISIWFISSEGLRDQHEVLKSEHVKLKAKLQKMQALERENENLRHLLHAAKKVPDRVLMAELIEVSLDPYTHKILVDKGLNDGAHIGQPVFDPSGVMGQITQVMPFTSAVTLITDPSHALPVQVQRNGLRAIAFGTGNSDRLRISYLSPNANIRVGDVLLSSGLGGRFPEGYPAARVVAVKNDPGEAFLSIDAIPIAQIDRASQVLLVWRGEQKPKILAQEFEDSRDLEAQHR
ncbi:MAG: rod shape-determining protein MreC [Arenicellales bacterium]|nr:rod shape-determining protein MreC [Arenicellales bacterium]